MSAQAWNRTIVPPSGKFYLPCEEAGKLAVDLARRVEAMRGRIAYGAYLGGSVGLALTVIGFGAVLAMMPPDLRVGHATLLRHLLTASVAAIPLWALAGGITARFTGPRAPALPDGPPKPRLVVAAFGGFILAAAAVAWTSGAIAAGALAPRLLMSAPPAPPPVIAPKATSDTRAGWERHYDLILGWEDAGRDIRTDADAKAARAALESVRNYRAATTTYPDGRESFESRRAQAVTNLELALERYDGATGRTTESVSP